MWYRNNWSWGYAADRPALWAERATVVRTNHRRLGERWWYVDSQPQVPQLLFTENETNRERLFGVPNAGPYVKDAFHEAVVHGRAGGGQSRTAWFQSGGPLSRRGRAGGIYDGPHTIPRLAARGPVR